MRRTLSIALSLLILWRFIPAAFGADSVAAQITALPPGSHVELHLKNKESMRGVTGKVSTTSFTLIDTHAGEHQVAFDDVATVRTLSTKSHLTRNVLIGVGVGVAAIGITAAIIFRCGAFGCKNNGRI